MKKAIIFILMSLFTPCLLAQTQYEDVVYLKNGSIIRGIIIEQVPNVSIKIKSEKNVFVFQISEIEKMTKEEIVAPNANNDVPNVESMKNVMVEKANKESGGLITIKSFLKTDGESLEIHGRAYYYLYYVMDFVAVKDLIVSGVNMDAIGKQYNTWSFRVVNTTDVIGLQRLYSNINYRIRGRVSLYKTENKWNIETIHYYSLEEVANSGSTAATNTSDGATNSPITTSTKFNLPPIYLLSTNNPITGEETSALTIGNECTTCNANFVNTALYKISSIYTGSPRFTKLQNIDGKEGIIKYGLILKNIVFHVPANISITSPASAKLLLQLNIEVEGQSFSQDLAFSYPCYTKATQIEMLTFLLSDLPRQMSQKIYAANIVNVDVKNVAEQAKDGKPKILELAYTSVLDKSLNYNVVIVEKGTSKMEGGQLKLGTVIGRAEIKNFDAGLKCKVTDDALKIKEALDAGLALEVFISSK